MKLSMVFILFNGRLLGKRCASETSRYDSFLLCMLLNSDSLCIYGTAMLRFLMALLITTIHTTACRTQMRAFLEFYLCEQ